MRLWLFSLATSLMQWIVSACVMPCNAMYCHAGSCSSMQTKRLVPPARRGESLTILDSSQLIDLVQNLEDSHWLFVGELCYDKAVLSLLNPFGETIQENNRMNREDKGKAVHKYLSESNLLPVSKVSKNWDSVKEGTKEEYRRIGEGLAQDFIYGGKYELSLASLDEDQILYNGLFSCIFPQRLHNGVCHLLLLRSKNRDVDEEEYVQKMAIITQVPGKLLAIQRVIEYIATLVMEFFKYSMSNHPQDDVSITPENTTFIEYQPYCSFTDSTDITQPPPKERGRGTDISILQFQWENRKASNPGWKDTSIAAVNRMIERL